MTAYKPLRGNARRNILIAAIAQETGLPMPTPSDLGLVGFCPMWAPTWRRQVENWLHSLRPQPVARMRRARSHPVQPANGARVYFVRADQWIKIGTAINVEKRLRELKTGNPFPLEVVATMPGDRRVERRLHERFDQLRAEGEWFRAAEPLLSFVKEVQRREARRA